MSTGAIHAAANPTPPRAPLAKELLTRVRARVNASPQLSAARQRARQALGRRSLIVWVGGALVFLYSLWMVLWFPATLADGLYSLGKADAVLVLSSTAPLVFAALLTVAHLGSVEYSSMLGSIAYRPIGDAAFYREQFWGHGVATAIFAALGTLEWYGIVAVRENFSVGQWMAAAALAIVQIASAVAAYAWIVLIVGRTRGWWIYLVLFVVAVCCIGGPFLLFGDWVAPAGQAQITAAVYTLLPTGWGNAILKHAVIDGSPAWWGLLVPLGLLLGSIPLLAGVLARRYQVREFIRGQGGLKAVLVTAGPQSTEPVSWSGATGEDQLEALQRADNAAAREARVQHIRSGAFLVANDLERRGPIEWLLCRMLTPEQRRVAELMAGPSYSWSRTWMRAIGFCGIMWLVGFIGQLFGPHWQFFPWFLSFVVMLGLMLTSWIWPGSLLRSASGRASIVGRQPVMFRDVSACMLRLAMVQSVFYLPLMFCPWIFQVNWAPNRPLDFAPVLFVAVGVLIWASLWLTMLAPAGFLLSGTDAIHLSTRVIFGGRSMLVLCVLGVPLCFANATTGWGPMLFGPYVAVTRWAIHRWHSRQDFG